MPRVIPGKKNKGFLLKSLKVNSQLGSVQRLLGNAYGQHGYCRSFNALLLALRFESTQVKLWLSTMHHDRYSWSRLFKEEAKDNG